MIGSGKKIIRIGGTSYSGSTMIDLMLANAKNAFSCGEVHHIFRPTEKKHLNPIICGCGEKTCKFWGDIQAQGEDNLWDALISEFPTTKVFVDSSKNPAWFRYQQGLDRANGFSINNILIWKTPMEFAYSMWKRNRIAQWKKAYVSYHTRYFSVVPFWYSVRYSDLAENPTAKLNALCQKIGISYFSGKEKYWLKKHHSLFGSHSAKIHLHEKSSVNFNTLKNQRVEFKPNFNPEETIEIKRHKSVYYDLPNAKRGFPIDQVKQAEKDPAITAIQKMLEITEIESNKTNKELGVYSKKLKPFILWYQWIWMKRQWRYFHNVYRS